MDRSSGPQKTLMLVRMLPVLLLILAAMAFVLHVEGFGFYAAANMLPMLAVLVLSWVTLHRGRGRWSGAGWRWPLGTLGFALPAVGLSVYLHYAYAIDLDGMASEALDPAALFRYLPIYTGFAGAIGFAIGWIAGRNI